MAKIFCYLFIVVSLSSFASSKLKTTAQLTQYLQTARMSESTQLCETLQKTYPKFVRCMKLGFSPENRELMAVLVQGNGVLDSKKIRTQKIPVLYVQASIHAGEMDGKDAVYELIVELLQKNSPLLKKTAILFVPIVNPDGHERFGKNHRPNQNGPLEMGWRTNAQNLNLNRDYGKLDSLELRQWIKLWNEWDPILSLDLHVTDGAKFEAEGGVVVANAIKGVEPLRQDAFEFEQSLISLLNTKGRKMLDFYPDLEVVDDPSKGFSKYIPSPKLSHGYWAKRNRMGVLVEVHSWKDYATRVKIHRQVVESALELTAFSGSQWLKSASKVDQALTELEAKKLFELEYKISDSTRIIDFAGVAYEIKDSSISGAKRIVYDENKPQIWRVPFKDEFKASLLVEVPKNGYYIEAGYVGSLSERLKAHQIQFEVLHKPLRQTFNVFRATEAEFSLKPSESRQTLKLKGAWKEEKRALASGSLFIPIQQKYSALVMSLLEPQSKDSFIFWGFMNAAFEKKEYMENYVAEEVAAELLKNPEIRKEFEEKLKSDTFKNSPDARLEFFYRKHPSWDEKYMLAPVYKY